MSRVLTLPRRFTDEEEAREYIEAHRWPNGPVCPHCGLIDRAYKLTPKAKSKKRLHVRRGVWKCAGCRKEFTVTIGTIMEDSHIPLHKWLLAYHLLGTSKKALSSNQLHRMLGITYRSAWFLAHRIFGAAVVCNPIMCQSACQRRINTRVSEFYWSSQSRGPNRSEAWKKSKVAKAS